MIKSFVIIVSPLFCSKLSTESMLPELELAVDNELGCANEVDVIGVGFGYILEVGCVSNVEFGCSNKFEMEALRIL